MRNAFPDLWRNLLFSAFIISIPVLSMGQDPGRLQNDTVHFRVNMSYMVANGTFNPGTDTIDLTGTMNNWHGSPPLERIDTSYVYQITYVLSGGVYYQYRYRIHAADTIFPENADPMSRTIRVRDTTMTVTNYYNNYNPAVIPVTFNCNLWYQVRAGHFNPVTDYLDVAGNFNNWGSYDVLLPKSYDSLYTLIMFFDTSLIAGDTLQFKFRINGDWSTSELQGDTSRVYPLNDTLNVYSCWYDNIDPSVPALPFVYDVTIHDSIISKHNVTGAYHYEDYNLRPEGKSLYRWYVADSIGGALTAIDSAWYINYTIDSLYIGKYLVFEVTPVTIDSVVGLPEQAWSAQKIIGVGIHEPEKMIARIYPNPVHDFLNIELFKPVEEIMIINTTGKMLINLPVANNLAYKIDLGDLAPGIYLLRLFAKDGSQGIYKFILSK